MLILGSDKKPQAQLDILMIQALYGITDRLTAAVYVPIVLRSRVVTNLSWEPGDYQSQLGRSYSEEDFWGWASSLGQPRVPAVWATGSRRNWRRSSSGTSTTPG